MRKDLDQGGLVVTLDVLGELVATAAFGLGFFGNFRGQVFDLRDLGLDRDDSMSETEDHFAYLCEVMRYLIAGDDVTVANLTHQRAFFATHIQPWSQTMTEVIAKHPRAKFFAALAEFTESFLGIEAQGFDLLT